MHVFFLFRLPQWAMASHAMIPENNAKRQPENGRILVFRLPF
ncbi:MULTISPECIES: hypothetical protein [Kingella]|nr:MULTISPECIES: hypothetical protein [Kingella]